MMGQNPECKYEDEVASLKNVFRNVRVCAPISNT